MVEIYKLYHNNPNVKTLEEFCQVSGVYFDNTYGIDNFFEDNKQRIFNQMDVSDRLNFIKDKNLQKKIIDLTADDLTKDVPLPCPITLVIPKRLVTYTMSAKHASFQEPVFDTIAFEDAQIKSSLLEENIKFLYSSFAKRERAKCSVIGFFKTLYYNKLESDNKETGVADGIYQTKSNFTDISDFVFQLNTSVGQQGGTFSFSLPHIPLYHKFDRNLNPYATPSDNYSKNNVEDWADLKAIREEMYSIAGGENKYAVVKSPIDSMDYFNWLISPNDLIFISFDDIDPDSVSDDNIAGQTFDMIGLVDSVSLSRDSNGNITVNVSGKDLMKLLSDDSSIFFPNATSVNKGNFFDNTEGALRTGDLAGVDTVNGNTAKGANGNAENMMRMPSTGSIRLFYEECNGFTIDYIIKVVIRELTNMQICPSEIFNSWRERRTKFAYLTPKNTERS